MRRALILVVAITLLVILALALPVQTWRTGELSQPELQYSATPDRADRATRVWIDADAACGTGRRRDPDDCLAVLSLASAQNMEIVGISTSFGNAPVSVTDSVMRKLVHELGSDVGRVLPVFKGCGAAAQQCLESGGSRNAQAALRQTLQAGAVDYVALGPLTNLAAVLTREPALASRITRIIAVMGRRPGHRFHPSENRGIGAMLFGHGPIFRDLNAVLDTAAISVVLRSGVAIILVPYTAARQVSLTRSDLDRIAGTGRAGRWVAERSLSWLDFWRRDVGLNGFYPFDLMAAAYARDATDFRCAHASAWVGDDALLGWFDGGPALLVAQAERVPVSSITKAEVRYCDVVGVRIDELFR